MLMGTDGDQPGSPGGRPDMGQGTDWGRPGLIDQNFI